MTRSSTTATASGTPAAAAPSPAPLVVAAALGAGALLAALGWIGDPAAGWASAPGMRAFADLRDLLAGRPWHEVAAGAEALPVFLLAVLAAALSEIVGRPAADLVVVNLWPPLLFSLLLLAAVAAGQRIGGWRAGLLAAVLAGPAAAPSFLPGRIDAGPVEILAVAVMAAGCVRADEGTSRGVAAGVAFAFLLALGPGQGAATLEFGLGLAAGLLVTHVYGPAPTAAALGGFGLALATTLPAIHLAVTPPAAWLAPGCGPLSPAGALVAALTGLGLAGIARLGSAARGQGPADLAIRGGLVAGLLSMGLMLAALAAPGCFDASAPGPDPAVTGSIGRPALKPSLP